MICRGVSCGGFGEGLGLGLVGEAWESVRLAIEWNRTRWLFSFSFFDKAFVEGDV